MAPTEDRTPVLTWNMLTWKHAIIGAAIFVGLLIYAAVAAFTARMIARKFLRGDRDINLPLPVFGGLLWPFAPFIVSVVLLAKFAVTLGYRAAAPKAVPEKETESNLPEAKVVNR